VFSLRRTKNNEGISVDVHGHAEQKNSGHRVIKKTKQSQTKQKRWAKKPYTTWGTKQILQKENSSLPITFLSGPHLIQITPTIKNRSGVNLIVLKLLFCYEFVISHY